jgi:hypothetical protein
MTNEEFQQLVLDKLGNLSGEISEIKQGMVTKEDVSRLEMKLENGFSDIISMSEVTQKAVKGIDIKLDRIAGDVSYLVRKASEHDDQIRELRKA